MNDAFRRPQTVVVFGGTSDIAQALVRRFAAGPCHTLVLAGRDSVRLKEATAEAQRLGIGSISTVQFDAGDGVGAEEAVRAAFESAGNVDLLIMAVGALGDQKVDETDPGRVREITNVNFVWPVVALADAAKRMKAQGQGQIVVLSSVAGIRVRRSNFIYGSTKAGLDAFALGLGESLRGSGVSVQIVRPGFVHSKMTLGLNPAPFATDPDSVADAVLKGIEAGDTVVWVPGILRWVFSTMQLLPQRIWRRLPG